MNFCYITIILHQFLSARLIQIMSTFGILMACWTVYPQKYMAPSPIVQISYFSEDVTPALESPLAFGTARSIRDSLSARGRSEERRVGKECRSRGAPSREYKKCTTVV